MNELHASGAFYAAQLTRFRCEWCGCKCAFVVEMFSRNLAVSQSCCAGCAAWLKRKGWVDSVAEYEKKP
jgi:hypothetical protein